MTESLARVPWYPLVFPLFYGALAVFGLLMARHLRVFGAARPVRPFANVRPPDAPRSCATPCVQTRMFRDARAGVMHYAIFAAFVLLSVGTWRTPITGGLVGGDPRGARSTGPCGPPSSSAATSRRSLALGAHRLLPGAPRRRPGRPALTL